MSRIVLLSFVALASVVFWTSSTFAQSGMFGQRSLGGGVNARGSTAFGGGGVGAAGAPGQQSLQGQAEAGQITGNERFVRDARAPGQFVGADATDTSAFNTQQGAGGLGGRGGFGGGGFGGGFGGGGGLQNLFSQFGRGNAGDANQRGRAATRPQVPISLGVAFDAPQVPPAQVQTRINEHLTKSLSRRVSGASVVIQGRTVVLRGTADSEYDKRLAARLAMLEPGVSNVQNEIVVSGP